MKRKLTLAAHAAYLAFSLPPAALAESELYPVTNPQCNVVITQPEDSSGYYLNRDCTAAFILPPKSGAIKVERIARLSNLGLCPALDNAHEKLLRYQDLQDKLLQR